MQPNLGDLISWLLQPIIAAGFILALFGLAPAGVGERVLGHYLDQRLASVRHEQNEKIEELKAQLAHLSDRGVRSSEREYLALVPSSGGSKKKSETRVSDFDPIQAPCEECANSFEFWERSLGNMAGDAISMEAFWSPPASGTTAPTPMPQIADPAPAPVLPQPSAAPTPMPPWPTVSPVALTTSPAPIPSPTRHMWIAQLIGESSETVALSRFRQMQRELPSALGSYEPAILRTTLKDGTIWVRVRVEFDTPQGAEALCSKLEAARKPCLVQRNFDNAR